MTERHARRPKREHDWSHVWLLTLTGALIAVMIGMLTWLK